MGEPLSAGSVFALALWMDPFFVLVIVLEL
jgi:hypothetical protein